MDFFINQISPWLLKIATYSALIPFLVGLWYIRKQKSLKYKLLFLFVLINVLSEAVAMITVQLGTKNNLWLFHLYTLLSFTALAVVYYSSFENASIKKIIVGGVVGLLMIIYYEAFITDGILKMNSLSRMAANSMLILLAIAYFYKVANTAKVVYLDHDPIFLLSCAVLIYYSGTSMSYALFNQALAVSYDAAKVCLSIVFILNILFYASQAFILRRMAT